MYHGPNWLRRNNIISSTAKDLDLETHNFKKTYIWMWANQREQFPWRLENMVNLTQRIIEYVLTV